MADEPNRNRPRLNTTISQGAMATLENLTDELGLPHIGITIDYIVTERTRLLAALRTVNQDITPSVQEAAA